MYYTSMISLYSHQNTKLYTDACVNLLHTYLPTYLLTYMLTYLPTYSLTYLLT